MAHITWKSMADDLLNKEWGEDGVGANERLRFGTDHRLMVVLLLDIARSLRVLRCQNFIDVPRRLDRIRLAAEGLRRDSAAKKGRR